MMTAGIEVEVLEKCIPWVGSCGSLKGEIRQTADLIYRHGIVVGVVVAYHNPLRDM
jgi:hypothetical protein